MWGKSWWDNDERKCCSPLVKFNPTILLFVILAAMSISHSVRVNKILNWNQYVNIDMMPLINIVASIVYTFIDTFLFITLFFTSHHTMHTNYSRKVWEIVGMCEMRTQFIRNELSSISDICKLSIFSRIYFTYLRH